MPKTEFKLNDMRRSVSKRVPTEGKLTGYTSTPDGYELADIVLTIDLNAVIQRLGLDAMRNIGGKSIGLGGLIVAKATNRRRFK